MDRWVFYANAKAAFSIPSVITIAQITPLKDKMTTKTGNLMHASGPCKQQASEYERFPPNQSSISWGKPRVDNIQQISRNNLP